MNEHGLRELWTVSYIWFVSGFHALVRMRTLFV